MGQCFLYGNGGKDRLKLRIFGQTTPPPNPKNNDIWVNTSLPIGGWEFSEVSNPGWGSGVSGFVYFTCTMDGASGSSASTGLNFLKEWTHAIYTKLLSCSQYDGSSWPRKDAYIYHDKWVQFSSLRINLTYFADQCTGVTGGWSNIRWFTDSNAAGHVPTVSWNSDGVHIKSDTPPGPGGIVVTKNAVNLTGWSKIVVNCASVSGTEIWCRVSKNTGDSFMTGEVTYIYLKAGVNTLDITSLNGVYYIGLCTYYNNNMVVSQVYLE